MAYNYIQFGAAKQLLANRLYDTTGVFWADAERGLYIIEALRTWNALTGQWATDYVLTVGSAATPWFSLNASGSPRQYTLHDTDLYTIIEYHLLEPPTGGTWTGTLQFSISDLSNAFANRQNEILQLTACNCQKLSAVPLPALTRRVSLADTVLDVRRARFVPNIGNPNVLWRSDAYQFQAFQPSYRQSPGTPRNYSVSAQPPLTLDVDFPPNVPGSLDILGIVSGTAPAPPANTLLAIPNDWAWVLKWGMLGDLLGKESEARDQLRMQYANSRYAEGVKLMQSLPWVLGASFNNIPVGIVSVKEKDTYGSGWEMDTNSRRSLVVAGTDLVALSPVPQGPTVVGLSLQVIQNAPVPTLDADPVQVSRDVLDVILDYAFHLATFKEGGQDFTDSMPLFDNFRMMAKQYSRHELAIGPFRDVMDIQGRREEITEPRFTEGDDASS